MSWVRVPSATHKKQFFGTAFFVSPNHPTHSRAHPVYIQAPTPPHRPRPRKTRKHPTPPGVHHGEAGGYLGEAGGYLGEAGGYLGKTGGRPGKAGGYLHAAADHLGRRVSDETSIRIVRNSHPYRPIRTSAPSDTYIRAVRYAPAMMVTTPPNTLTTNALLTVDDHSTTSVQRSPDNGRDDAVSGSHITTIPIHPVTGQMGIAGNRRSRLLHLLVHSLQGD